MVVSESKRCARCHEVKPRSDFHRDASQPSGLTSRCKACVKACVNKPAKSRPPGFVPWNPTRHNSPGWVENDSGCHVWLGQNCGGYGRVWHRGFWQQISRVRYEREIGPIPDGLELDHYVCDNGAGGCCNPYHCRPVTRRENALRGSSPTAFNLARTHCPNGHQYSETNTYRSPEGWRQCRICRRAYLRTWQRTYRARRAMLQRQP